MLFEYTYFLKDFDADLFSSKNILPADFIIPLDEQVTGNQPALFQALLQSESRFCFCLPACLIHNHKIFIRERIIQHLVKFLFLPNYLKIEGKHAFFFEQFPEAEKNLDLLKNDLYEECRRQGIKIILVEMVAIDNPREIGQDFALMHPDLPTYSANGEKENAFEKLSAAFTNPVCLTRKWVVPVTDFCDFKNKTCQIANFETWIKQTEPFKMQLLGQLNLAVTENAASKTENELLKFKLDNNVHYLQLIRKESQGLITEIGSLRQEIHRLTQQIIYPGSAYQGGDIDFIMQLQAAVTAEQKRANETLNWYINEYEVLPGWFKKLGQLIRVVIGKRTFKSLFKKNNIDQGRKNTQ